MGFVHGGDGVSHLVAEEDLLFLGVFYHHVVQHVRGLDLVVADKLLSVLQPKLPMVIPEILSHQDIVDCHILCVVDFGLWVGQVPTEIPGERLFS